MEPCRHHSSEQESLPQPGPISRIQSASEQFLGDVREIFSSHEDRARIRSALELCIALHLDQEPRADGLPYPLHPISVAQTCLCRLNCTDADQIIAALLHDTLEDQPEGLARFTTKAGPDTRLRAETALQELFGPRVCEMVKGLSKADLDRIAQKKQQSGDTRTLREIKNEAYHDEVISLASSDWQTFCIKLIDMTDNALRIESVTDIERREKLMQKYGPVLVSTIGILQEREKLDTSSSEVARILLPEFREALATQYHLPVPAPQIGGEVYLPTSLYLSHGADDFAGGVATVSSVQIGNGIIWVEFLEQPGDRYNWGPLAATQCTLQKEFGDERAHPDPDYRPEFNEGW